MVWFELVRAVLGILGRFVRRFISERELEKADLCKRPPLVKVESLVFTNFFNRGITILNHLMVIDQGQKVC